MTDKFKVSLKKIIDEFKLETIFIPKAAEEIFIDENDVNRPGLQLMGFYEYFNPERIQIIGKMEFAYLSTIDEKTRYERLEKLFSQKLPALIITRELPYLNLQSSMKCLCSEARKAHQISCQVLLHS